MGKITTEGVFWIFDFYEVHFFSGGAAGREASVGGMLQSYHKRELGESALEEGVAKRMIEKQNRSSLNTLSLFFNLILDKLKLRACGYWHVSTYVVVWEKIRLESKV